METNVREPLVQLHVVGEILSAMKHGQGPAALGPEMREVQVVDVEVQSVELAGALAHLVEDDHVVGQGIAEADGHLEVRPSVRFRLLRNCLPEPVC
jgi:hypothetical protein